MAEEQIKMPRREVKDLTRGELFWVHTESHGSALLAYVQLESSGEESGRVRVANTTTTYREFWEPGELQRCHDAWCALGESWECSEFGAFEQNQTLYFADRYCDPTRYVGWSKLARNMVKTWPDLWTAFINLIEQENDRSYGAFETVLKARKAEHQRAFPDRN